MRSRSPALLVALVVMAAAACESSTRPDASPISQIPQRANQDSLGTPISLTPPPGGQTPGYFQGTVLGPSAPGAGNDSLETAPRVVGATIDAYPVLEGVSPGPQVGPLAASTTTDADGRFVLPTLPGGTYAVVVTPPAASPYGPVWVMALAHENSHVSRWWVVLYNK